MKIECVCVRAVPEQNATKFHFRFRDQIIIRTFTWRYLEDFSECWVQNELAAMWRNIADEFKSMYPRLVRKKTVKPTTDGSKKEMTVIDEHVDGTIKVSQTIAIDSMPDFPSEYMQEAPSYQDAVDLFKKWREGLENEIKIKENTFDRYYGSSQYFEVGEDYDDYAKKLRDLLKLPTD